jgi:hypothetical protein
MPSIKRDWTIRFDPQTYIDLQGASFAGLLQQPKRRAAWESLLEEAPGLIEPAGAWDAFSIKRVLHERLELVDGTKVGGGPVTQVVGGAEDLVVSVVTVGPKISARVAELRDQKQLFNAMLLDDLGSWAVDQVRQQMCRMIEADAKAQGLRASASLSPGESEWSVKEQEVLFKLLDTSAIGVTLSPSMIMQPLKSLSLIVGTGRNQMGVEDASNCDFCSIKDRCAHRKRRAA